jgi:16S rRNA (cytosine1402-N4)-methyltransferase
MKFVWSNYADVENICMQEKILPIHAVLADLGFSSEQIDDPQRGLSFMHEGPLDMRYDRSSENISAAQVVNSFSQEALGDLISVYGEEPYARKIARVLIEERKKERITTTRRLTEIIEQIVPRRRWHCIHPATRTFQALRIYVNHEFENVQTLLRSAQNIVAPGGRIGIISFHSLEDRIVKQTFKAWEQDGIVHIITKKPIIPTDDETEKNPRSRSAKLRIAEMTKSKMWIIKHRTFYITSIAYASQSKICVFYLYFTT